MTGEDNQEDNPVDNEDPDLGWLRQQVDQAFEDVALARAVDRIELVTTLASGLAVLSLLIGLAIIAPL